MADQQEPQDVRIEIKMIMSVTDPRALRDAAIDLVRTRGVWHVGPDATPAQRQEEIDRIEADPAHAVSNLVAFMNLDDLVAERVPGLRPDSSTVGAKVGRPGDFD
ncbi:hypothetical protein ABGB18_43370 [Nonomuraea sp. B12E4]|uniref:hypothetical protein n=1 Tax=Nonomuraea sp. B12E4 TaxID=3153564 RepID=UPI00325DF2BF